MAKRSTKATANKNTKNGATPVKKTPAKKTPAKKTAKTAKKPARQWSPEQRAVQAAGKITGDLMLCLQNIRKTFLRIGKLLTEVRDRKHYEVLHNESLEQYADKRLGMSAPTMYRYMKVYEWVLANRKEWLEDGAKIPEMSDIGGLVWIDQELAKKDLGPARETTLQTLRKKALDGKLLEKELRAVQRRTGKSKPKSARTLALLRSARRQATRDGVSDGLIAAIEQAIRVAENDLVVETAGLHYLDGLGTRTRSDFQHPNTMLA